MFDQLQFLSSKFECYFVSLLKKVKIDNFEFLIYRYQMHLIINIESKVKLCLQIYCNSNDYQLPILYFLKF